MNDWMEDVMDERPRWEPGQSVAGDKRPDHPGPTHRELQTLLLAIIAVAGVAVAVLIYTRQ